MYDVLVGLLLSLLVIVNSCSHGGVSSESAKIDQERILDDLHQDLPTLDLRILKSLPERELPQLEHHFVARAPHHPWLFGHLLSRYGTIQGFAGARSAYDSAHLRWGCDSRIPFLAYFLRVSPSEGEAILRTALEERVDNGCYHDVLSGISRIYAAPQLEPISIQALNDRDPQVAANAAMTLSWYGSAASEQKIWTRLELWSDQWRDRADELRPRSPVIVDERFWQDRLGDSLREALIPHRLGTLTIPGVIAY